MESRPQYTATDILFHVATIAGICDSPAADEVGVEEKKRFFHLAEIANTYSQYYIGKSWDDLLVANAKSMSKEALSNWQQQLKTRPQIAQNVVKDMISLGNVSGMGEKERKYLFATSEKMGISSEIVSEANSEYNRLVQRA